jgi:carbon-monoxide dehydrogenase small subunit
MSAEKRAIQFKLNGRDVSADVAPHWNMVELLQGEFGLTGARESCGQGLCGCCTVLMDGEAVTGCLSLAVLADGKDIETIESQDADGELSAEQRAFIESGGLQCGYCTPGMILMTKKLLDENPDPTDDDVRHYLSGNLCRCAAYPEIIAAVHRAATLRKAEYSHSP